MRKALLARSAGVGAGSVSGAGSAFSAGAGSWASAYDANASPSPTSADVVIARLAYWWGYGTTVPMMMLGGSPTSVAVPPMFEASTSTMR